MSNYQLGIICGGPSLERGISLNSARSAIDHIKGADIVIYYINPKLNVFQIPAQHLYSNTPEDFDFKIDALATLLTEEEWIQSMQALDIVLPLIHGEYGEDGQLQDQLERWGIPFIGSGSAACRQMFPKDSANHRLQDHGFPTVECLLVEGSNWHTLFDRYKKVVLKPQIGGSSIGVHIIESIEEGDIILSKQNKKMVCEAFCEGIEFTVVVLGAASGPVALVPVEVDIGEGMFFDYRRKYLPTSHTKWFCPPRFSKEVIAAIQKQAETVFSLFNMQDYARLDGWYDQGKIIFSDINPVSGLEQNSFIFLQASRIGLTHSALLHYIIEHSANRQGIYMPVLNQTFKKRIPVAILMGGDTEERQVSLMSGTNIWLKLYDSQKYQPCPYFLDKNKKVWFLPYTFALTHTVEDIEDCLLHQNSIRNEMQLLIPIIRSRLGLKKKSLDDIYPLVVSKNIEDFILGLKKTVFFNALHGGFGENGTIQALLEKHQVAYNGSNSTVSNIGMDKWLFAMKVNQFNIPNMSALKKEALSGWTQHASLGRFIIKPRSKGCSHGVQAISNKKAFDLFLKKRDPKETYIVEPFIETDQLYYKDNKLNMHKSSQWLELTIVVCESTTGYQSLLPSVTVSQNQVLTVEEKFQGGTGINITPPPEDIISKEAVYIIQQQFEKLSQLLMVNHYVRYDFFYNYAENRIIVIEMNTLPALTPSTVLYQQMLISNYAKTPQEGIEQLLTMQLSLIKSNTMV